MWRKITNQFQKEICPYCFEYFYLKDTPFRCCKCKPEPDNIYQSAWADSRPRGKVLKPSGKFLDRFNQSIRCENCEQHSYKRICPHCHSELPHTVGQLKNYIFATIGAKDAGKSHYIAVLIEQIRKQIGPNMGILLTPINEETNKRYQNDFYNPVYKDRKIIEGTKSAMAGSSVRQPLLYSVIISDSGNDRIKKAFVLVFFDTAGEDINDEDVMSTVNKYIYRSDGLILLMDPLQLSTVRSKLPSGTALPEINTEIYDILNRTTRLIEKGRHLKHAEKIKTPLAIAFSKFDAVLPIIDEQFQLHASANHENGFDTGDFDAINSEMLSLLDQWEGQDIIQMTQTRYAKYGFFGLSALGCNPHDTKKISSVIPRRVEDPFLWLLAQNRTIPVNIGALSLWGHIKKGLNYLYMNTILKFVIPIVFVSVIVCVGIFWPEKVCSVDGMAKVDQGTYELNNYPSVTTYLASIGKDKVDIKQDFLIQTGEVTVAEFRRFVKSGSLSPADIKKLGSAWSEGKDERGKNFQENSPVSRVPWDIANQYAQWMSTQTNCRLQLPTQEQWAAAVMSYADKQTGQKWKLQEIEPQKKTPDHLLFNREEWSSTPCANGKGYKSLGYDYFPNYDSKTDYVLRCPSLWGSISVGIRLIKEQPLEK
jgi:hypothetical protein